MQTLMQSMEELVTSMPVSRTEQGACADCGVPTQSFAKHPFTQAPIYRRRCERCEEIRQAEAATRARAERLKGKPERFRRRLISAGLEKIELSHRFGNFTQNEANRKAFAASFGFARGKNEHGVFLIGDPGCGKTHLAAASLKVLLACGMKAKFYKITDLLGILRATNRPFAEVSEEQVIEELASYDVLFLDDFGVERPTEYVADVLYRIIDRRYRRELPIFATSNLDLGALAKRIDDRIPSRLAAMCEGQVIRIKDKDWRL